ncbi:Monocarboxylate permease [Mycena venus]|uniref:Monocarboxylate permease n=1 Tax=Mycena venus TaxID=2733690 RepID=A0A8H6YSP9_9AGAR|nr:Monocarboxylate permease [Mycena venus]
MELPSDVASLPPPYSDKGPVTNNQDPDEKEEEKVISSPSNATCPVNTEEFPDGGFRAWAVVFGVFWIFFSTVGCISSWGVFQVYYQQVMLPSSSASDIAWIGSVQRCILFLPGLLVGRLVDYGFFRIPFVVGSILMIAGTFLISVCRLYWHFLLCQGFMIGVGCGLTYAPSATVLTHWWNKRRGLAFGVASGGSAVGGIFFPIALRELFPRVGFTWTLRIMGFIMIFTLGMANLCLVRRLPANKVYRKMFALHVLRRPAFSVFSLSCFIVSFGVFTVGGYIASSAVSYGISSNFAFYLVAMHNGALLLGSIVLGFFGDRLGAMNVLIPTLSVVGVLTIVWPFCDTIASLTVLSILYGFLFGAFNALGLIPVAAMGDIGDLGLRLGIINTVLGIGGLCGPPLGGLLIETSLRFKAVGYFAGGVVFLGTMLYILARFLAVPKLWAKF